MMEGTTMKTRTIDVYSFNELDERGKERARDWYRQGDDDNYFAECILDKAPRLLALCGIQIDKLPRNGNHHAIYWSGFSSQGDGACFEGSWNPATLDVATLKSECPATYKDAQGVEQACEGNTELHAIADESARLAALDPDSGIGWSCKNTGHYNHEYSVTFDHSDEREPPHCQPRGYSKEHDCNGPCSCRCDCIACTVAPIDDIEDDHEANARDAMRWIYRQLEREYEYQTSDEVVDENIIANEYEFDASGNRI